MKRASYEVVFRFYLSHVERIAQTHCWRHGAAYSALAVSAVPEGRKQSHENLHGTNQNHQADKAPPGKQQILPPPRLRVGEGGRKTARHQAPR